MMNKPYSNLHKIIYHSEKYNGNKDNKKIFNKKEGRCRDVKTQKPCNQGREVNVGPKIKQTSSIYPT